MVYHYSMNNAEWKKRLTPEQFRVLRGKGTEAPFSGELLFNNSDGTYVCAGCGSDLFKSGAKFDSDCGWPNFYDVYGSDAVDLIDDNTHGMERIEVVCSNCQGHLGHLFEDSPEQPTGLRYCVNSVSLNFAPEEKL